MTRTDLMNEIFDKSYDFMFEDNKSVTIQIGKDDNGEPNFQIRLQDMTTGEILDCLDVNVTEDHRWLEVVK